VALHHLYHASSMRFPEISDSGKVAYAPTLFLGLGGSGVRTVSALKKRLLAELGSERLGEQPIVFRALDYDPTASEGVLAASEFHVFDSREIALLLRNLKKGFSNEWTEISEWFPALALLRVQQAELSGAARWRPLGRLGTFLNWQQISAVIREAAARLQSVSSPYDSPRVYLIASIAGGTGSGMLFDVAAEVRQALDIATIDAVLLLPEVFDGLVFTDRIFPTAYAVLAEIAALQSGRLAFPRESWKRPNDPLPLFSRVLLSGPWIGQRRLTIDPSAVFDRVAEMMQSSNLEEVRRHELAMRANAVVEFARNAKCGETASVFSTLSTTVIRLIDYDEFAGSVASRFIAELAAPGRSTSTEIVDILAPLTIPPADRLMSDMVRELEIAAEEVFHESAIESIFDTFFNELTSSRASVDQFPGAIRKFLGEGSDDAPPLTAECRAVLAQRARGRLDELRSQSSAPRAFDMLMTQLRLYLPPPIHIEVLQQMEGSIEAFQRQSSGTSELLRYFQTSRIVILKRSLFEWMKRSPQMLAALRRQAVSRVLHDVVETLVVEEQRRWAAIERLHEELRRTRPEPAPSGDLLLDARRVHPAVILRNELRRLAEKNREVLSKRFLEEFAQFYGRYAESSAAVGEWELNRWLIAVTRVLRESLATEHRFVSPESTFTDDDVANAVQRCETSVFRQGRTAMPCATRVATISVPASFRDRATWVEKLVSFCAGLLHTRATIIDAAESRSEISLIVEDLFYPLVTVRGIQEYRAAYEREPEPEQYHFRKDWPKQLLPWITMLLAGSSVPSLGATASRDNESDFLPGRFNLGLVVPLHEEFESVLEHWPVLRSTAHAGTTFIELDMTSLGLTCIATVLREMGPSVAANRTEKLLNAAEVSMVILLGLGGSLDKGVELADVVVADEVNEFAATSKAVPAGKDMFVLEYSGAHFRSDYSIIDAIANWPFTTAGLYREWQSAVRGCPEGSMLDGAKRPRLQIGHIASGDTVGAAEAFRVELKGIDRKFVALEMEAAGVARAAEARSPTVPFLIVRGISDYSDERKGTIDQKDQGMWRRLAIHSACHALTRLLQLAAVRKSVGVA